MIEYVGRRTIVTEARLHRSYPLYREELIFYATCTVLTEIYRPAVHTKPEIDEILLPFKNLISDFQVSGSIIAAVLWLLHYRDLMFLRRNEVTAKPVAAFGTA